MSTLKDVANDAGVSIATVSYCLTGSRPVKPETKARVMDSIEKLKYIPNASARNLKIADSKKIGVVLTDIDNTYHAEIFKGISSQLQAKGYSLSVAFSNNSPDIECEKIEDFVSSNISGLLIITSQPQNTDFFVNRIKKFNIPTVFVERRPSNIDASFIGFDNYKTTYYITDRLLEQGYRNIALITGAYHFSSEYDAIEGYKTAYQSYGLTPPLALIENTSMTKEDTFKTILNNPLLDEIEAVITTSENISLGVLEAFKIQGIRVPFDAQVITFSEESWNMSSHIPGVISTSRTAFTLGTSAADLLFKNIDSPILFEEKSITFTDEIVHSDLTFPKPKKKNSLTVTHATKPLRILMVDLETSHSTELLSKYFTRQTDIPIEISYTSQDELLRKIIEDVERPNAHYDMYMYDVPWLEYMVQNGLVADITDYVDSKKFHKDSFFKENLDNCMFENKYFGIPIVGGSQIMFYRKDLFENRSIINAFKQEYNINLRPPRTWTEFNGIASFFTRSINPNSPTLYGTSVAGIVDEEFAPEILIRLWANGGTLWDKYNRVCMNTPENVKALSSILQTLNYVQTSPLETSIEQTVDDFCTGKTAMLVTYTEYANKISTSIQNNIIGRVGYETLPGRTPASIGWNFGINPYTTRTEEAFWYFQWLCRKDISIYMTILDGQSPVISPYQSHELLKLYPWLELTEKSFSYCRKRNGPYRKKSLVIPQNRIESILCSVLKKIILEKTDIQTALTTGQQEMELLFKSYGYPKPLHFLP